MKYIRYFVSLIGKVLQLGLRQQLALLLAASVSGGAVLLLLLNYGTSSRQPLYTNMSREDVGSISRILSEKGYDYDSGAGFIAVAPANLHRARLLLAMRGLPSGQENGLPVFDGQTAFGLGTLVGEADARRIAKGEIERNLNAIPQVRSSRVHISLSRKKSNDNDVVLPPSASVILKYDGRLDLLTVNGIRNLVAASVPGLASEEVTLVGANGVLISKKNAFTPVSSKLAELEREFSADAEQKISAALGAYLGYDNLRISVSAKLNQDEQEIDEVRFDPNSKVERSVQVVREAGKISNSATSQTISIDENLPEEPSEAAGGNTSTEDKERREELTNYEIDQKKIQVLSKGYRVEKVSAAVVVNDARIRQLIGANADEFEIDEKLAEILDVVKVALNFNEERGDVINISAMEFYPNGDRVELEGGRGLGDVFSMHFGNLVNSISLVLGTAIFTVLAIGPITNYLNKQSQARAAVPFDVEQDGAIAPATPQALSGTGASGFDPVRGNGEMRGSNASPLVSAMEAMQGEEERARGVLEQLVSSDEQRAFAVIRSWLEPGKTGRI